MWSEVNFSEALNHNRFSAEYWRPEYLEPLRKSLPWQPLGNVLKGVQYGISREMNEENLGLPCFRMNEMDTIFLSRPQKSMVVTEEEKRQFMLKKGNVLFNRTNSLKFVGRTGYCDQDTNAVFASYLMRLFPDESQLLPTFLAIYLNTSVGIGQVKRRAMESINQANVSGSEVKLVPIPLLGMDIQRRVDDYVHFASEQRHAAQRAYAQAEELLESALALHELDLRPRLFYERPYSDVSTAGRFDAEYFQPPKKTVLNALVKMSGQAIGEQCRAVRQLWQPDKASPTEQVRNYDLPEALQPFLDETVEPTTRDTIFSTKKRFEMGDLVVSRLRSYLKEIAVVLDTGDVPMVGSTEFIVLRPDVGAIRVEALLVYLRSRYVQTVLKWCQDGSNHPRFDEKELLALRVPDVVRDHQDEIAHKVNESIHARREGRRLLEEAKAMVERAILGS